MKAQFREIFVEKSLDFGNANESPVIVDCGANIGMSVIALKCRAPGARIIAYEPDPQLSAILKRNLGAADVKGASVREEAAWVEERRVGFDADGGDRGRVFDGVGNTVSAIDLSAELPPFVDLLKMDIEGAEYEVIWRLVETNGINRVGNLVAEFHVRREDFDRMHDALAKLRAAGFELAFSASICPWIGRARRAAPFDAVSDLQMLMTVYGWRDRNDG